MCNLMVLTHSTEPVLTSEHSFTITIFIVFVMRGVITQLEEFLFQNQAAWKWALSNQKLSESYMFTILVLSFSAKWNGNVRVDRGKMFRNFNILFLVFITFHYFVSHSSYATFYILIFHMRAFGIFPIWINYEWCCYEHSCLRFCVVKYFNFS